MTAWNESYQGAPIDGRAWYGDYGDDCSRRVLRGGSWFNRPDDLRSANRSRSSAGNRYNIIGFRLARTIN